MRTLFRTLALLLALAAAPVRAQFANHAIGLSVGYMKLNDASNFDWGVPVGLYGTTYLEGGFDLTYHVLQAMILTERISGRQAIGIAPSVGVRYLFLQEFIRPYAALDLAYLHIFTDFGANNFVGLGPNVGFDWFVSDTWSVGLRGQWNFYFWLNEPIQTSLALTAEIATYY